MKRSDINSKGWGEYAANWGAMHGSSSIPGLDREDHDKVKHLGEEWSVMQNAEYGYGLNIHRNDQFQEYLRENLFGELIRGKSGLNILEIGPGGGRATVILLPHSAQYFAVDISKEMLQSLYDRFRTETRLQYVLTDGKSMPGIQPHSIDLFVTFDAMVHCEPHEIFAYLSMARMFMKPGAMGLVHFSDIETPMGFAHFSSQASQKLEGGVQFHHFSAMNKAMMQVFLDKLGFETISISNKTIPRDAVAIFRSPGATN